MIWLSLLLAYIFVIRDTPLTKGLDRFRIGLRTYLLAPEYFATQLNDGRFLIWHACDRLPVLHDVDCLRIKAGLQTGGLMGRPFVLTVVLSCCYQYCQFCQSVAQADAVAKYQLTSRICGDNSGMFSQMPAGPTNSARSRLFGSTTASVGGLAGLVESFSLHQRKARTRLWIDIGGKSGHQRWHPFARRDCRFLCLCAAA